MYDELIISYSLCNRIKYLKNYNEIKQIFIVKLSSNTLIFKSHLFSFNVLRTVSEEYQSFGVNTAIEQIILIVLA